MSSVANTKVVVAILGIADKVCRRDRSTKATTPKGCPAKHNTKESRFFFVSFQNQIFPHKKLYEKALSLSLLVVARFGGKKALLRESSIDR